MYLNEIDPFAAEWLANLFPDSRIDQRDIRDVRATDISGVRRCHFFAGIGGWELALRWAGWPEAWPVWTGSCPCQPFSAAGKRKGTADERHVWPEFRRLIAECRPPVVFGEQVASKLGRAWLAGVRAYLETLGYAVGAADLCAASVGAPQIRQRLWWVGLLSGGGGARLAGLPLEPARQEPAAAERSGVALDVALGQGDGRHEGRAKPNGRNTGSGCDALDMGGADINVIGRIERAGELSLRTANPWRDSRVILCRDGKARRVSAQPGDEPLVDGIPRSLGRGEPGLGRVVRRARSNRVGRLRGYGNAIVPILAARFIRAVMETILEHTKGNA